MSPSYGSNYSGSDSSSYPEFTPPKDLADSLEGDSGEAMVKWRRKPNGDICFTSMDGVPLDTEEDKEPDGDEGEETPMERAQMGLDRIAIDSTGPSGYIAGAV